MARRTEGLLGLALALTLGGQGARATDCELVLNVTDKDPAGLNVRATPGGTIIGALKGGGEWVQVHVTGQSGAWARIDEADLIPENQDDTRALFSGSGYVAFSKLGIEYLIPNGEVLAAPQDGARPLLKLPGGDEGAMPKAEVIGCSGEFIQVRVKGLVGWTRTFCTNQLTTCV